MYIADNGNSRIRKVTPAGIISTVAGGANGSLVNGAPATSVSLNRASSIISDSGGNIYFVTSTGFLLFPVICKITPGLSAPTLTSGGFLNAADYTQAFAPGMIISAFGGSMASSNSSATGFPLPTVVNGASIEVNGEPIPLFFVSPNQINGQLPFGISGQVKVVIRNAAGVTTPQTITVLPTAPRLFTKTQDGKGEAVVFHSTDFSLVTSTSPARSNETVIIFLTGLGTVSPAVAAGQPGGDNGQFGPLNQLSEGSVKVAIGGLQGTVLFAGLAPGFVGLYQVNLKLPPIPSALGASLVVSTRDGGSQSGVTMRCAP